MTFNGDFSIRYDTRYNFLVVDGVVFEMRWLDGYIDRYSLQIVAERSASGFRGDKSRVESTRGTI